MKKIQVKLGRRSYPILIKSGLLSPAGKLIRQRLLGVRDICIITDKDVARLYLSQVTRSCRRAGFSVRRIILPVGETQKSLTTAKNIYQKLLKFRFDRSAVLVALGGGVIGDLTGFVAATYLRGVNFIQIPTTLLAQVDAGIGGKVGVNLSQGKNLVGAFYQPRVVLIDPRVLRSLPRRQMKNGWAEIIKYAVIKDGHLFKILERNKDIWSILEKVIVRAVVIKSRLVAKDERDESGVRMILNYGHTVGHALESLGQFKRYQHGEAVALGMTIAANLAVSLKLVGSDFLKRQTALLEKYGLPIRLPAGLRPGQIISKLKYDKKISRKKLHWVLPRGIGRVMVSDKVSLRVLRKVL
ncbi:MAG: 3-dehydroquinate synthase [Planctomycetes bacterium]|nr:3-dehydroquinate synthase [Planctomycetota bacterium]